MVRLSLSHGHLVIQVCLPMVLKFSSMLHVDHNNVTLSIFASSKLHHLVVGIFLINDMYNVWSKLAIENLVKKVLLLKRSHPGVCYSPGDNVFL